VPIVQVFIDKKLVRLRIGMGQVELMILCHVLPYTC